MFCLEHLNQVILIKRVGPHLPFTNFFDNANLSLCSPCHSFSNGTGSGNLPALRPPHTHPPSLLPFQMASNWKEPSSGSIHTDLKRRVWEALRAAEHSQNSTQWSWLVSHRALREIKTHPNWDCFLAPVPLSHFRSLLIWLKRFGSNCDLTLGIVLLRLILPLKRMCSKSGWGKMTSDLSSNPVILWLLWTGGGRRGPQTAFTLSKISQALHDFKSIYSVPLSVGYSLNTCQDSLAPSMYILLRGWWAYLS